MSNGNEAQIGEAIRAGRAAPLRQVAAAVGIVERARVVAGAERRHDVAALAQNARLRGRAGGGPDRRMRLLKDARPDIDLAVVKILALPVEDLVVSGHRFDDEIESFPEA